MKLKAIIIDIDGTLADCSHRRHLAQNKNWKEFFDRSGDDDLNHWCFVIMQHLKVRYEIILCTGRSEDYRLLTQTWLTQHGVPYKKLFMRKSKDYREDCVIKKEIYKNEIEPEYDVVFCVDDRQQVVDMWRAEGLVCLQCDKGDF